MAPPASHIWHKKHLRVKYENKIQKQLLKISSRKPNFINFLKNFASYAVTKQIWVRYKKISIRLAIWVIYKKIIFSVRLAIWVIYKKKNSLQKIIFSIRLAIWVLCKKIIFSVRLAIWVTLKKIILQKIIFIQC